MKYLLILLLSAATLLAQAQQQILIALGTGSSYTGPGDVITSNVIAYWGLRAYSSATRGNKLANVCDASDAHCVDMLSSATTGNAVIPSSNPDCTSSGCTVKTLYDLTGNLACNSGTACDVTQATIANRPTLTVNCIGSTHPCLTWTSSSQVLVSTNLPPTESQPYSAAFVAQRTTFTSGGNAIMGTVGGTAQRAGFGSSANQALMNAGGADGTATASDGSFHAVQVLFNGSSSVLAIDGSSSSVTTGSNGISGGLSLVIGTAFDPATNTKSVEFGLWLGDKSANFSALSTNQHSYWGF